MTGHVTQARDGRVEFGKPSSWSLFEGHKVHVEGDKPCLIQQRDQEEVAYKLLHLNLH